MTHFEPATNPRQWEEDFEYGSSFLRPIRRALPPPGRACKGGWALGGASLVWSRARLSNFIYGPFLASERGEEERVEWSGGHNTLLLLTKTTNACLELRRISQRVSNLTLAVV